MPHDLLSGPRGRRLCLELAAEASGDVRHALFDLAYNADVAAGAAVVRLAWNEDGTTSSTRGPIETTASAAGLADTIHALGVLAPTAAQLHAAMLRAVDSARYWQEPDGEEIVAADAAVCASLEAVAAAVSVHPDSAWWSHPWGCPHTTGTLPAGVPAGVPFVEDGFGWTRAVAVPVRGGGRTLEIRTAEDWAALCRRFPIEVTASRRHDWYRVTGRDGRWLLPDWGRVAGEWDAVHLTARAYLTAATREIPVDAEYASVIGGWGPDETYWLTGLVREVEGPHVHWRAEAPEGPWQRAS